MITNIPKVPFYSKYNANNSINKAASVCFAAEQPQFTYVVGHTKPDADSVVSAKAEAALLLLQGRKNIVSASAGDIDATTKFIFDKFDVTTPVIIDNVRGQHVVLVDHNEKSTRLPDIETDKIDEIIDHHKLDFQGTRIIPVLEKPVGATATIIKQKYDESGVEIPKPIAGIMLGAILADTRNFKQNTTPEDKKAAHDLAKIAGIKNIDEFGREIISTGQFDYKNRPVSEALTNDFKEFHGKKGKIVKMASLAVSPATNFLKLKKAELLNEMNKYDREDGKKSVVLLINDFNSNQAYILHTDKSKAGIDKYLSKDTAFKRIDKNIIKAQELKSRKVIQSDIVGSLATN